MDKLQQLLQVSAQLYQYLTKIPLSEERDSYIERIDTLLDERGACMQDLLANGFKFDTTNRSHQMLAELDKGIRERLNKVMEAVKEDMKELNNAKKNEKQYINPYASVSTMDGRYYDNKQ
ncbi:flagellar protein FliT [Metasolibacillus meyeri]|uniref:Flagellar protein FliT n=1 Tax=Metasolibacillus meyeri TaxID=1071052 RepID=A0AAW9NMZ4_9BACL|nr:flagellar protein FliT [Metasolibacillus meyeri]MEC1178867.1 flagellar protein FliT [Metasolibacillus meyeri]